MIRIFFVIILFLIYGNFNFVINDIDVFIFILSTFVIEVFVGLPILIGIVFLFIPLILLNFFINNYNFASFIKSSIIFLLSFVAFYIFDQSIDFRLFNLLYFINIFILILIFLGISNHGKE